VNLIVYDPLGRKVAVLVNEVKQAGNHKINFDTSVLSGLSSGIYFYTIRSAGYTATKKMILLR